MLLYFFYYNLLWYFFNKKTNIGIIQIVKSKGFFACLWRTEAFTVDDNYLHALQTDSIESAHCISSL